MTAEGRARLVRRRETFEDLVSRDEPDGLVPGWGTE
jgi:hypothetical protein